MRTDKKIDENRIIVAFGDEANKLYIRRPGNQNKEYLDPLVVVENGQIKINMKTVEHYGLIIVRDFKEV